MHDDQRRAEAAPDYETVLPDLEELCRIHDVGLDLIRRSHDLDELLGAVLSEYERRLGELRHDTFERRPLELDEAKKLRALVMFASQASALKQRAAASTAERRRSDELARLNAELERVLAEQRRARRRLDEVLAALDWGIVVVGTDGRVEHANRAAAALVELPPESLVGRPSGGLVEGVEPGGDGEVETTVAGGDRRLLFVSRRPLGGESEGEVVLLGDLTERQRRLDERHRLERLADLLKTLAVLSHKINNPLTALMGRAQLLRLRGETDPQVRKACEVIEESAKRISDYIRELALVVKEGREGDLAKLLDFGDTGHVERFGGQR